MLQYVMFFSRHYCMVILLIVETTADWYEKHMLYTHYVKTNIIGYRNKND